MKIEDFYSDFPHLMGPEEIEHLDFVQVDDKGKCLVPVLCPPKWLVDHVEGLPRPVKEEKKKFKKRKPALGLTKAQLQELADDHLPRLVPQQERILFDFLRSAMLSRLISTAGCTTIQHLLAVLNVELESGEPSPMPKWYKRGELYPKEAKQWGPQDIGYFKCANRGCFETESVENTFRNCAKCKIAFYCGRTCQVEDWSARHKQMCKTAATKRETSLATTDFLNHTNVPKPANEKELFGQTFKNMEEMLLHMLQNDDDDDDYDDGDDLVPSMMKPPIVTSALKHQISSFQPQDCVWYAHWTQITTHEAEGHEVTIWLVTKEKGSDGKPIHETNSVSLCLATCMELYNDPGSNVPRPREDGYPVILGAIAKACMDPMGQFGGFAAAGHNEAARSCRPRKVLFQSTGTMHVLESELQEMGIAKVGVANSKLIKSAQWNHGCQDIRAMDKAMAGEPTPDPANPLSVNSYLAKSIKNIPNQPRYVSDKRIPLRGWRPDEKMVPMRWFARPPKKSERHGEYRLTELWGWRTNLERAVMASDIDKIKEICQKYNADDIKEFCELRVLLAKMAHKGMVDSCEALLDLCGVWVEGELDPRNTSYEWKKMQAMAGGDGTSPLHRAVHEGYGAVAKVLLDHGASLTLKCKKIGGTALHHCVAQGNLDCVKLLCKRGADPSLRDNESNDVIDVSLMMATQGGPHVAIQEMVREILRQYDLRCSNCRRPGEMKQCPCSKERYCGPSCQRARWKEHKKLHKSTLRG